MKRVIPLILLIFLIFCGESRERESRERKKFCGFLYGMVLPQPENIYDFFETKEKFIKELKELGINAVRIPTEAFIKRFDKKYKIEDIKDKDIEEYILLGKEKLEKFLEIATLMKENGIFTIGIASIGYTSSLPCYGVDECPFEISADVEKNMKNLPQRYLPDIVGEEEYISFAYLQSRALARYLKGKIDMWQIENEINVPCETILFGWRHGKSWCDKNFVYKLVSAIAKGIKEEDEKALLTINFHTDYIQHADLTGEGKWFKGFLEEELTLFSPLLDVIGFDFYPNYFATTLGKEFANPKRANLVYERIERIKRYTLKPIIVVETGYPTQPTELGFSEENQAEYIKIIYSEKIQEELFGVLYFILLSSETPDKRPEFQSVEPYWGLYRKNKERKKGFYALRDVKKETKKCLFF